MISNAFKKANRLWFRQGRTAAALTAYEDALREAPEDPVVAFQLARVLWSLDRFDEARALLELAETHSSKLSATGQIALDLWRDSFEAPPPERYFPELPPALLDRDRLEAGPLPVDNWRTVADAAASRGMHGLATYALDRWGGVPIDAEDAKEIDQIESRGHSEEAMLAEMYAEGSPGDNQPGVRDSTSRAPTHNRNVSPSPHHAVQPPVFHAAPAQASQGAELPTLPLNLTIRATPTEGPLGVPTALVASLRNPTDKAQIVNRRMLLNYPNAPGEIWLDIDGPEGYRNTRGFRVRAGPASNEFFVSLSPGEAIEQSWDLNDYESLQVPGEYRVTLTYHNEASQTPDGRPMVVGKVIGSTRFHRH